MLKISIGLSLAIALAAGPVSAQSFPKQISSDALGLKEKAAAQGANLSGVWDLHVGLDPAALIKEAEAGPDVSGWSSLYVKFEATGAGTYRGAYVHPTIAGRAAPNCPYDGIFDAHSFVSNDLANYQYPAVSIVQSGNFGCSSSATIAYQAMSGTLREANVGASLPRYIIGTAYNNSGNSVHILLVYNAALSSN